MLVAAAAPALADDLGPTLDAALKGSKVPAIGMLVMRDGKVAALAVRGVRRIDRPDPVRASDVWLIGSDAKAMTATLVARLVDKGVLSWDAPLGKMLPDLAPGMRPDYRGVTLVQLLSHHAGLPHDILDPKLFAQVAAEPGSLRRQRLDYIALALKDPPVNRPATAFSYSNTGFLIAAVIAERATGVACEDLMRREVFAPLGMTSVGFGVPPAGEPQGHVGGAVADARDANPAFFAPPGNIYLSLGDWARFCLDQMAGANGHGRLLATASYRLMQTPAPDGPYGLGWGVVPTALGREGPALTHSGSDGNWYAIVVLFPRSGSGILVTANAGEAMGGQDVEKAAIRQVIASVAPPAAAAEKAP
jgi:CubicO group peptidase (beta-lactamase class C family)